jgi:flagellar hook assembly protein FlgD
VPGRRALTGTPLGDRPALALTLAEAGEVRVEVYDLQGRRLARLAELRLGAGTHVLPWDGRDERGGQAPSGLYFARATTPAGTVVARLLLR